MITIFRDSSVVVASGSSGPLRVITHGWEQRCSDVESMVSQGVFPARSPGESVHCEII